MIWTIAIIIGITFGIIIGVGIKNTVLGVVSGLMAMALYIFFSKELNKGEYKNG